LQEPPPPVDLLNPAVTPELVQIVNKLLAKEPAARYRTAGQLARILDSYAQAHGGNVVTPMRQPMESTTARQTTAVLQTPISAPTTPLPDQDTKPTAAIKSEPEPAFTAFESNAVDQTAVDPTAIALGIIAIIALLGLIPLWFMVYRAWTGG
jgi:serine/threonine-protein kinase